MIVYRITARGRCMEALQTRGNLVHVRVPAATPTVHGLALAVLVSVNSGALTGVLDWGFGGVLSPLVDFTCSPFQATPKTQFSLSGRSMLPMDPETGFLEASLTYTWTDRQYSASPPPDAEPGAWLPEFGLLNANLTWMQILGSRLNLQLFGTNLTNEEWRISNSNQWNLTYFKASMYSEPRIIGVNLSYEWQ